jgi:hypothetical protein
MGVFSPQWTRAIDGFGVTAAQPAKPVETRTPLAQSIPYTQAGSFTIVALTHTAQPSAANGGTK